MERQHIIELHRILSSRFNRSEFQTLCFYLGINFDDLAGEALEAKARELLAHCERRERLGELVEAGKQLRPEISWDDVSEPSKEGLPALKDISPEPAVQAEISIPRKVAANVIIVDDDVTWTRVVTLALERAGLSVAEAHTPQAAIELVKRYQPDAILITWHGGAGTFSASLIKELKDACPDAKIIGLTPLAELHEPRIDFFDAILHKPVKFDEIIHVLAKE